MYTRTLPTCGGCRRALEAESPADGDDDRDVAEGHHEDRQQPGQREEVEEVGQLQLLVGEGDRVETLSEKEAFIHFLFHEDSFVLLF